MPLGEEVPGGMVLECMVEEPLEPMPSFEDRAEKLSQVEVAALRLRSEVRGPGHRSLVLKALHTEVQTVEEWAANGEKPRSVVQLIEEDTEVLSAAAGRWSSADYFVRVERIAGVGLLEQGRNGWKTVVTGKAEVKAAAHIAALAVPGQGNDTDGLAHCSLRLVGVMRSVVSSDGLVHTAEHVRPANSLGSTLR